MFERRNANHTPPEPSLAPQPHNGLGATAAAAAAPFASPWQAAPPAAPLPAAERRRGSSDRSTKENTRQVTAVVAAPAMQRQTQPRTDAAASSSSFKVNVTTAAHRAPLSNTTRRPSSHHSSANHSLRSSGTSTPTYSSAAQAAGAAGIIGRPTARSRGMSSAAAAAAAHLLHEHMGIKQRNLVVLGAGKVGKTAICVRFTAQRFDDAYHPTYENSFARRLVHDGHDVHITLKDTLGLTGHEMFRNEYALGYHAYILVFDVFSRRSFSLLKGVNRKLIELTAASDVPRIIVGSKIDLADNINHDGDVWRNESAATSGTPAAAAAGQRREPYERQVSTVEAQRFADRLGCEYVEVSAKSGHNIDLLFHKTLARVERHIDPEGHGKGVCRRALHWIRKRCVVRASSLTDSPRLESLVKLFVMLAVFVGMGCILAASVLVGLGSGDHESLFVAYCLFGFGFIVAFVSFIGLVGMQQSNQEFLQVYTVSLAIVLITQCVVWAILYRDFDLFHDHAVAVTLAGGIAGFIEVAAIVCVCFMQRRLSPPKSLERSASHESQLRYYYSLA